MKTAKDKVKVNKHGQVDKFTTESGKMIKDMDMANKLKVVMANYTGVIGKMISSTVKDNLSNKVEKRLLVSGNMAFCMDQPKFRKITKQLIPLLFKVEWFLFQALIL